MRQASDNFISPDRTIADAIRLIEANTSKIALVVDANHRLLGTITDGDIRRGLLRLQPLDASVDTIMKSEPLIAHMGDNDDSLRSIMMNSKIRYIPIVDKAHKVMGLVALDDLEAGESHVDNWVVLMAGGLGSRLMPITEETPKPLLHVGDKPLLETILESFIAYEFRRFYIAVNYKADKIRQYFGDGSKWNAEIRYLEEDHKLGTAGALGLIPEMPKQPLVVMNGDVLTKVNFRNLLDFHSEHDSLATMCVREYDFQVPFGVVHLDGHRISLIEEKPVQSFFVNAGIYALEPEALRFITPGISIDMTTLFQRILSCPGGASVFPIREYWIDVGRLDDFHRANHEYTQNFG